MIPQNGNKNESLSLLSRPVWRGCSPPTLIYCTTQCDVHLDWTMTNGLQNLEACWATEHLICLLSARSNMPNQQKDVFCVSLFPLAEIRYGWPDNKARTTGAEIERLSSISG